MAVDGNKVKKTLVNRPSGLRLKAGFALLAKANRMYETLTVEKVVEKVYCDECEEAPCQCGRKLLSPAYSCCLAEEE